MAERKILWIEDHVDKTSALAAELQKHWKFITAWQDVPQQDVYKRQQEILPPIGNSFLGLSAPGVCSVLMCAGALAFAGALRASSLGIRFRALLDDSSVCAHYGFSVSVLATLVGGLAGGLTGVAGSSFGVIYARCV